MKLNWKDCSSNMSVVANPSELLHCNLLASLQLRFSETMLWYFFQFMFSLFNFLGVEWMIRLLNNHEFPLVSTHYTSTRWIHSKSNLVDFTNNIVVCEQFGEEKFWFYCSFQITTTVPFYFKDNAFQTDNTSV